MKCNGIQGLCDQLTRGFISFLSLTIYIYMKCNGMQDSVIN